MEKGKIINMQVNNKISFKANLSTVSVLEVTTQKVLGNNGMKGIKEVICALNEKPINATGKMGYKHYAQKIGSEIVEKYAEVKTATERINKLFENNGDKKPSQLATVLEEITSKLGENIDIKI